MNTLALPTNPFAAGETLGKDYLLYVNTGMLWAPVWTLIGGQRNGTLNRKSESVDSSNLATGAWKTVLPGLLSWSIDLSGLVLLNDAGIAALETAFEAQVDIQIKFLYPSMQYRTGNALITELDIDTSYSGAATLKGTLIGDGALSGLTGP
jgi:predicted secreted protein